MVEGVRLASPGVGWSPMARLDARGTALVGGDRWRVLVSVAEIDELAQSVGAVRSGRELLRRAQAVGCWPSKQAFVEWCEREALPRWRKDA